MALAVLCTMEILPPEELAGFAALGELSLAGDVVPVSGVLPAAISAAEREWGLICRAAQGPEAAWAGKLEILAAPDLISLINHFRGAQILSPPGIAGLAEPEPGPDLARVKGMELARRAMEIAAAGGHHMLMVGPPGAGKSMLASRLPGILPDLAPMEALEVSMVHSVAGMLKGGAAVAPPALPGAASLRLPGGAHGRRPARPAGGGEPRPSRRAVSR